ncbi:MAG: Trk system potassium transporter TrkA [Gammaproteobacteria bacterium]|nr:Trk system potassium transporter TrkA [Gammaproteobacteria bacterium]MCP5136243.1 Trk system potassium transporter TrkA [Gammaproteobacteria bacterium]
MKKIIILGAGQVGSSLAQSLAGEDNDITLVDQDAELLQGLRDRLDVQTVHGPASQPSVLEQAGGPDADLLVAVTNSDETNMVACQIAHTLFHTPTKIARVRAADYVKGRNLFGPDKLPIDHIISPEQLVTDYIERLIEHPGALQVLDFADGRVQLVAVRAYHGGWLVGKELRKLKEHMPKVESRVAAIFRGDRAIKPQGHTVIEPNDEVFFVAASAHIRAFIKEYTKSDQAYRRIIIAGGGNIGRRLAAALEPHHNVKIIERDPGTARALSEDLRSAIVLNGDAADENLLIEENIEHTHIFCAVTNDDEANILSAMLAKRLGVRRTMALINRSAYVDLVQGSGTVDIAISPQQATIGSLLTHIRLGDVAKVHSLRRGAAEAMEAIAHGDVNTSQVVGRRIDEIRLPTGATIGAIARGEQVLIAHDDTVIEPDDHVILFLVDKRKVAEVERLFQVSVGFF